MQLAYAAGTQYAGARGQTLANTGPFNTNFNVGGRRRGALRRVLGALGLGGGGEGEGYGV